MRNYYMGRELYAAFYKNQMQVARRANLYDYLMRNHLSDCIKDGNSLRPKCNHSISVKKGYAGYKDFASGETGNSVDFLVRYMGYDLDDAVFALVGQSSRLAVRIEKKQDIVVPVEFPKPLEGRWKQLYAYLQARGISVDIINLLIRQKIIYQSIERNNIIFVNKERDFAEARGHIHMVNLIIGYIRDKLIGFGGLNHGKVLWSVCMSARRRLMQLACTNFMR